MRFRNETIKIGCRHRAGEVKALCALTPEVLEIVELILPLNALGRHLKVERFGHSENRGNER